MDITFPTATHLYGLPEHATSFRLRGTHAKGGDNKTQYEDPYRLYNLDVFEYELNEPMALYGSVPFMAAHTKDWTGGALFLNSAEMWIDVDIREPGSGNKVKKLLTKINKGGWLSTVAQYLPESLRSMIGSAATDDVTVPAEDSTDSSDEIGSHHAVTHWIAETGLVDVFLFPGTAGLNPSLLNPKGPANPFRALHAQYARLTGTSVLPPLFSTAYHQCRWNYMDEQDVKTVDAGFDTENIPMDVLWLDIEHTDGKRYFTWDPHKFPNSTGMVDSLSIRGRRVGTGIRGKLTCSLTRIICFYQMVTIIDPHLKRDDGFSVYKEAMDLGLLVKDRHRNDYDGWCWPGSSSWTDYINPAAREWWSSRFALDKYQGSTLDLFTWNDMNEPSVFNGPEITMHKDAIHHGGWEHRDVHNVYGMLLHQATYDGHHFRTEKELGRRLRPFVLSRAFFVGTQRFGAIWTGDNMANWEHLEAAVPMLLSISTAGIAFSGGAFADRLDLLRAF